MTNYYQTALIAVDKYGAIQKPLELAASLEYLHDNYDISTIVEIGADAGGTLWAWQQTFHPTTLITIDLPKGPFSTKRNLVTHGATVIAADSHNFYTWRGLQRLLDGDKIDLLFIDGDHTYNGVMLDYVMYSPLVANYGAIMFHDICHHPHDPEIGVDRFWRDLIRNIDRDTISEIIIQDTSWGGIGIIPKQ